MAVLPAASAVPGNAAAVQVLDRRQVIARVNGASVILARKTSVAAQTRPRKEWAGVTRRAGSRSTSS
ncbi:MAG: hypothetical protein ACM3IK_15185 [Sphingomonadaceae bacterium]